MTNPPNSVEIPDAPPSNVNHAEWDRAYRAWERRRALPRELEMMDRREAGIRERNARVNRRRLN